jgi:hypothetical protein
MTRTPRLYFSFGQPPVGVEVMWRCEARRYSVVLDAEAEIYGTSAPRLNMTWWRVKHRTPKGARLEIGTFVNLSATKKWANVTQELALADFKARKRKHISILTHRLREAEQELKLAEGADDLLALA